jgi:hypothetical protein
MKLRITSQCVHIHDSQLLHPAQKKEQCPPFARSRSRAHLYPMSLLSSPCARRRPNNHCATVAPAKGFNKHSISTALVASDLFALCRTRSIAGVVSHITRVSGEKARSCTGVTLFDKGRSVALEGIDRETKDSRAMTWGIE